MPVRQASPNRQYRPPSTSTKQGAQAKKKSGCGWPIVLVIIVIVSSLIRSCDNSDQSMGADGFVQTGAVVATSVVSSVVDSTAPVAMASAATASESIAPDRAGAGSFR